MSIADKIKVLNLDCYTCVVCDKRHTYSVALPNSRTWLIMWSGCPDCVASGAFEKWLAKFTGLSGRLDTVPHEMRKYV